MTYTAITFNTNNTTEQNEILVALLADIGFEGFEEENDSLKAFIKSAEYDVATLNSIAQSLNVTFTISEVEQQNWNAAWESSFEPVIIHDFAAIRADFHPPVQNVQHEIIITPKMSFGTGHHATTFLMMEQMSKIDFTNKTVLDFGTGTGVLAILAEKMGASSIYAIDYDDWSIENAKENLERNLSKHITIEKKEAIATHTTYDIILANINLNVITANIEAIAQSCKTGSIILLSGFLFSDEDQIKQSLIANGLQFKAATRQKDWICVFAIK